ncbi:hypothetical protein NIIDMKKI_71170 [Mycobacterium kansasii]|uniref:Uncharacterized protein n=1 Tax=Mycobacterium kansasii TaxID=1768 RepID=A0A7G1ILS9_MYCKA|nr:hypothetical protein NIIDMKKI_71170 [Mycobacterium kansasii]
METERHVVVGVQAGGDDDVQLGLRGNPGNARDIAPQTDHRQVDDGVHAPGFQLVEPGDRICHPLVLVSPGVGIVLHDFGGHDEYVLVHERDAEIGGIDRPAGGIEF